MEDTSSTSEFIEIELTMKPVPPGTKGRPRPADRYRRITLEDVTKSAEGQAVPPTAPGVEKAPESDS
jgi:hypothetical protein